LIARVFSSTRKVSAAYIIIVKVIFFGAEAHGSGGALGLGHGALRSALGSRCALRRLAPAPRGCVWAEVPAVSGTRFSRERGARRRGSRGTCCRTIVPGARFVYHKLSALELLIAEAAHRFLGVGPFAELNEGEPARLTGFAICGQRDVRERADYGEVLTQLSLGHVIGEVANKKAHSHQVLLQFGLCDVVHTMPRDAAAAGITMSALSLLRLATL
jgi:hypothetical protein